MSSTHSLLRYLKPRYDRPTVYIFTTLLASAFIFIASSPMQKFRPVKSDVSISLDIPVEKESLRPKRESVCAALSSYPRASEEPMAFERGEISALCRPFTGKARGRLDRCGDPKGDPYAVNESSKVFSSFAWSSRAQLFKQGKVNILIEEGLKEEREKLLKRIEELRVSSRAFCCQDNESCVREFDRIAITLCEPQEDPDAPDPCAFGGSFRVPGRTYRDIFDQLRVVSGDTPEAEEIRRLAERNLTSQTRSAQTVDSSVTGSVVLSSYISRNRGVAPMEPVILHEFGHACSMIRMRVWALESHEPPVVSDEVGSNVASTRALRATQWLDSARRRCDPELELPEAYEDFWEELGESKGLSSCLREIAVANQEGRVDRPCSGVCPGHYLEEAAGIAFSLLSGDLSGGLASVFPNTCDHVRDGQHPMVSDVVECLAQHSPRFRDRLKKSYGCS